MITADDVVIGESVVMTRNTTCDDAHFEITGKWVDPGSKETGLALVPDSLHSNVVVGTWAAP